MKSVNPPALRDVLLLSLIAGGADAVGYMGLDRVFTSNMTGNVVLLGIYLGQGDLGNISHTLFVLVAFALGVAIGTYFSHDVEKGDWLPLARRLINGERLLLILFAIGWVARPDHTASAVAYPLLAILAVAMGLQSAAMNRLSAPGVGTTAITSTITAFVTNLCALWIPRNGTASTEQAAPGRIGFTGGVLALYCLGAAASGLLLVRLPWLAGVWPALTALLTSWGFRASVRN